MFSLLLNKKIFYFIKLQPFVGKSFSVLDLHFVLVLINIISSLIFHFLIVYFINQ